MPNTDIVITEIMYDPVQSVHDNNHEWVEVTNTGASSIAMNGWTLDDSNAANSGVGTFGDVTLNPGDIAIFYNDNITEAAFIALYNPAPGTILIPVAGWQPLNNVGGDAVQLFDQNTDVVDTVAYADDANPGQSLNYTPDGTYEGAGVPDPGVMCFTAGSLIDTEHGPRRIETLVPGDRLRTLDHGLQTLRWIGRRVVSGPEQIQHPALCPIEIDAGALGPHAPTRQTRVSPQHRMLIAGHTPELLFNQPRMLCAAISLVNMPGIRQLSAGPTIEYVHILLNTHEIVFVDGQASESFFPNHEGLSALSPLARAELFALFPKLESAALSLAYPVMSTAEAALLNL
ncbi:MAG: Hint domain-containing protein [Rhodobacteraceae bacterium]|nr:Hint domain-containing protein [Paracoccaceae bacterium]